MERRTYNYQIESKSVAHWITKNCNEIMKMQFILNIDLLSS